MIKLLFEWLNKPMVQWTFIDYLFCVLIIGILYILIVWIYYLILKLKEKLNKNKRKK